MMAMLRCLLLAGMLSWGVAPSMGAETAGGATGLLAEIATRASKQSDMDLAACRAMDRAVWIDSRCASEFAAAWNAGKIPRDSILEAVVMRDSPKPRWYRLGGGTSVKLAPLPEFEIRDETGGIVRVRWRVCECNHALSIWAELEKRKELKGIILDLRGNPGGVMLESILFIERWTPRGKELVGLYPTVRDVRQGTPAQTYRAYVGGSLKIPIVAIIDHQTGSTAEVLAAMIKGNGLGQSVGSTTRGDAIAYALQKNGSDGQTIKPMLIKVAGYPFYQNRGVKPDYIIATTDLKGTYEQNCLAAARTLIKKGVLATQNQNLSANTTK